MLPLDCQHAHQHAKTSVALQTGVVMTLAGLTKVFTLSTLVALAAAPHAAAQKSGDKCPANATRASAELWTNNSLPRDFVVSGTHSCGRKITCRSGSGDYSRTCWWS
jgi:hypothetical protein